MRAPGIYCSFRQRSSVKRQGKKSRQKGTMTTRTLSCQPKENLWLSSGSPTFMVNAKNPKICDSAAAPQHLYTKICGSAAAPRLSRLTLKTLTPVHHPTAVQGPSTDSRLNHSSHKTKPVARHRLSKLPLKKLTTFLRLSWPFWTFNLLSFFPGNSIQNPRKCMTSSPTYVP
jgi:hypothetical protein